MHEPLACLARLDSVTEERPATEVASGGAARARRLMAAAAWGALACGFATSEGHAQGAASVASDNASNGASVQEVVVTARKTQERLQDVPGSVTALSGEALRERPIVTIQDISKVTPGLTTASNARSPTSVRFAIRGQSEADSILTTDSSVGIYMDDVNLPRTYGLKTSLFDVSRMEVLKGPQGTLYGKSTTGGAVNIFSEQPDLSSFGGYVDLQMGSWRTAILQGAINAPIIPDKLAVRIAGLAGTTNGFARTRLGQRLAAHEDRAVRAHVLFKPVDNLTIVATGAYTRSAGQRFLYRLLQEVPGPAQTQAGLLLGAPATTAPAVGLQYTTAVRNQQGRFVYDMQDTPSARFRSWNGALHVTWDLNEDFTLKSITGYQNFKQFQANDADVTRLPILTGSGETRDKFFSQELQLSGRLLDGRLRPIAGLYYSRERGNEFTSTVALPLTSGNATQHFDVDVRNTTRGAYFQAIYDLTDALSLTGGARYSEEIRGVTPHNRLVSPAGVVTCLLPPGSFINGQCIADPGDLKFSNTSYVITAAYRVTPDLNVYATHRTGFRAGGWNAYSSLTSGIFGFRPETVSDFEVGLKSELFDRRARANIALYKSSYQDIQKASLTITPAGISVRQINNAASATIQGVETEFSLRPTRSTGVDLSGAYSDAHYNDFLTRNPATGAVLENRTDEPFEFPRWSVTASAYKKWEVPLGVLSARADWNWQSKVIFTSTGALTSGEQFMKQDSYGLLGARVELDVQEAGLNLAVVGRNLLDKDYLVGAVNVLSLGWSMGIPGEPRYLGVEIRKAFGHE